MENKQKTLGLKYFVLKPKGNDIYANASRQAMLTYANIIKLQDPELSHDIILWVDKEIQEC